MNNMVSKGYTANGVLDIAGPTAAVVDTEAITGVKQLVGGFRGVVLVVGNW